jgi:hypothetical protein
MDTITSPKHSRSCAALGLEVPTSLPARADEGTGKMRRCRGREAKQAPIFFDRFHEPWRTTMIAWRAAV